jgi:hypothetical protein
LTDKPDEIDWIEVTRIAHQLEIDHGRNASSYAKKLAEKAEQEGSKANAKLWSAVSVSLKVRTST